MGPGAGLRIVAIDWSGAMNGARQKIWLAEVVDGRLVRLENGRDREQMARHLLAEAKALPRMVIGLDYAFSLPSWFLDANGLSSAQELWALADRQAEHWLAACLPPFWGRSGTRRPTETPAEYRLADLEVQTVNGIRPKSVFQINGAGAVGTGSLRGMGLVQQLHAAGCSIWPFDPPGWPRVVEIYPRALTGAIVKTDPVARAAYLARRYPGLEAGLRSRAASSDDAFDAAVSALVMAQHSSSLTSLLPATEGKFLLEGRIWLPPGSAAPGAHTPAAGASSLTTTAGRRPPARPAALVAPLPSGFVVGRRYRNVIGDFEVLAVDHPRMRVRYDDGRLATLSIPILTRIQERLGADGVVARPASGG